MILSNEYVVIDRFFIFSIGNFSSEIKQLRTCHRCHRVFSVLSELFNHSCDDLNELPSMKTDFDNRNHFTTSAKSFKLNRRDATHKNSSDVDHIPLLKRPLFQASLNVSDTKPRYASTDYIYLRPSSSPIHVNS